MSDLCGFLRDDYQSQVALDKLSSADVPGIADKIHWRPMTGNQQKSIQAQSMKSTAEGICMHVKQRAMNEKGELFFKNESVVGMMTGMDFEKIVSIFQAISGIDLSSEEIEGN